MALPKPTPEACSIKIRLIDELQSIHTEIFRLDNQVVEILIGRDHGDLEAIDAVLETVRAARRSKMEAIRDHVREHGC